MACDKWGNVGSDKWKKNMGNVNTRAKWCSETHICVSQNEECVSASSSLHLSCRSGTCSSRLSGLDSDSASSEAMGDGAIIGAGTRLGTRPGVSRPGPSSPGCSSRIKIHRV